MTTPYTYLLKHKPTNMFYYGVRFAKDCHPEEFWKTYFTSSKKIVPLYRTLFGDECWEFEIRRIFNTAKAARDWESKVLRRMKVVKYQDRWLNQSDNKAILNETCPMRGKKAPWAIEVNKRPEIREKRRQSKLGKKRKPFSEEWKRNMGAALKGRKRIFSESHREALSEALRKSTKAQKRWNEVRYVPQKGETNSGSFRKGHVPWNKHI